jgi:hypothetical protein
MRHLEVTSKRARGVSARSLIASAARGYKDAHPSTG